MKTAVEWPTDQIHSTKRITTNNWKKNMKTDGGGIVCIGSCVHSFTRRPYQMLMYVRALFSADRNRLMNIIQLHQMAMVYLNETKKCAQFTFVQAAQANQMLNMEWNTTDTHFSYVWHIAIALCTKHIHMKNDRELTKIKEQHYDFFHSYFHYVQLYVTV